MFKWCSKWYLTEVTVKTAALAMPVLLGAVSGFRKQGVLQSWVDIQQETAKGCSWEAGKLQGHHTYLNIASTASRSAGSSRVNSASIPFDYSTFTLFYYIYSSMSPFCISPKAERSPHLNRIHLPTHLGSGPPTGRWREMPTEEYWHPCNKPNNRKHVKHFSKVQLQKVFLLGAVVALNDCWALRTFNSHNPFSYNSTILEESARVCEHIFLVLAFLPCINDTNGNAWGVGTRIPLPHGADTPQQGFHRDPNTWTLTRSWN